MTLWERTRWEKGTSNIDRKLDTKQIASIVRKHLRKRFSYCKISVRSTYNTLSVTIKESPFNIDSIELKAIVKYCYEYANSFKHDNYSFYGVYEHEIVKEYDYKQTEQTEDIKKDIEDFNKQLDEYNKSEGEREEREYQEWLKEQEIIKKARKEREKREEKEIKIINNDVTVKDLNDKQQYIVTGGMFANLNKNSTYKEYQEEIEKGRYYFNDLKVTREIYFNKIETLELFKNHLLTDFDFIEGTGGCYKDGNKYNLMGIAVYYNNELQFVIDAQGYNYARYVGITNTAMIEKVTA